MCGIAGCFNHKFIGNTDGLRDIGKILAGSISHRGPDGKGEWIDEKFGIILTHTRLSIIDLSFAGDQPMVSQNGRYVLSYNGEIYNTKHLRNHPFLINHKWQGHSDTEVIVESIAARGIDDTLKDLNGMFAFALWDRQDKTVILARDRLGIKPIYYTIGNNGLIFGSELKVLMNVNIPKSINTGAVASFLRYSYVPSNQSIFNDVYKVLPGQYIKVGLDKSISKEMFYKIDDISLNSNLNVLNIADSDIVTKFEELMIEVISDQMIADVPIGAFLSGGIDSSTIVAMMTLAGKAPVKTFCIGFDERDYDESKYAERVANHLGTNHYSLTVTNDDALKLIPKLADIYDEPFADSSQIPTLLLSALTREHVKVCLTGDGGDELFLGYNRYIYAANQWRYISKIPKFIRSYLADTVSAMPINILIDMLKSFKIDAPQASGKISKIINTLSLDDSEIYQSFTSQIHDPQNYIAEHDGLQTYAVPTHLDLVDQMRFLDMAHYLPDDILHKVDRASMSVGLEVRPAFLDNRLIEFSWELPRRCLIRQGQSKWILREILRRHMPDDLFRRPKMGFGIPLDEWLRTSLKVWANDLIHSPDFGGGLINRNSTMRLWAEHLSGKKNHSAQLWNILTYESWRRRWICNNFN